MESLSPTKRPSMLPSETVPTWAVPGAQLLHAVLVLAAVMPGFAQMGSPGGGETQAVALHPTNSQILYVGAAKGLCKTVSARPGQLALHRPGIAVAASYRHQPTRSGDGLYGHV